MFILYYTLLTIFLYLIKNQNLILLHNIFYTFVVCCNVLYKKKIQMNADNNVIIITSKYR